MIWYQVHLVLIQGTLTSFLLALSVQVQLRCGVFSLAGIGFYAIGTYAAAILTEHSSANSVLAVLFGVVCACVVGYLLARLVYRLDGLYLAMATVAFDLILTVVATNGGSLTGGPTGLYGVLGNLTMPEVFGIVIVAAVLVAVSERGRLARRIVTTRTDTQLAVSMGINVGRIRRMSFVASAALGAAAGGINVLLRTTVVPTDVGFTLVVTILTMIIVGGMRSWIGVLIGAIVFTWLPGLLAVVVEYQAILYGVLVLAASVFLPDGVFGVAVWLYRKIRGRYRPSLPTPPDAPPPDDDADIAASRRLLLHVPAAEEVP